MNNPNYSDFLNIFLNTLVGEYGNDWMIPFIDGRLIQLTQEHSIARCKLLKFQQLTQQQVNKLSSEQKKNVLVFVVAHSQRQNRIYFDESQWCLTQGTRIALLIALVSLNQNKKTLSVPSGFAWTWIMSVLNLPNSVYPEIVYLLTKFLYYCGHSMQRAYPSQFPKIIQLIETGLLTKVLKNTSIRESSHRKLSSMIEQYHKNRNQFQQPEEAKISMQLPTIHTQL